MEPVINVLSQAIVYQTVTSKLLDKVLFVNCAIKPASSKGAEKKTYPVIYVMINNAVFAPLMKGCVIPA